jgi:hypothetical protein
MLTFHENNKTWKMEIDDMNLHIHFLGDNHHFSWRGCENCNEENGKILGADIVECQVYPSLEHVRNEIHWDKNLCAKCVYESHYGKGSYED